MSGKTLEKRMPLLALPLILAVCFALWLNMSGAPHTVLYSDNGIWDLRGFDFGSSSVRVRGAVGFIPNALLTPEEFDARSNEIQIGYPQGVCQYSTSRIRILLPEGVTYMLAGHSTDYAVTIFVNGEHVSDIGMPGTSRETMIPYTADFAFMCEPRDGVIEIVQQASNFVHREGGWHDDIYVGYPDAVRSAYRHDFALLIMSCFLILFFVHLTLFLIQRGYRANLYFSLFCLMWFLRSGVTGAKVFSLFLPDLSWIVKFRVEYISLPITGILVVLMLRELFPYVLPKWFHVAVHSIGAAFIALFMFADTIFMSWAMIYCYAYLALSIFFVIGCFIGRFRHPDMPQAITLIGLLLFFYAGVRDMFFQNNIILPPYVFATFSEIAMLIFVLYEMTAMFIGTARAVDKAKAVEQRLAVENELLARMNKLKSEFLGNISHELKTPLAVMSTQAQVTAARERESGAPSEYIVNKMLLISSEAERASMLINQLLDIARFEEGRMDWNFQSVNIAGLIQDTINTYYPVLNKNHNALAVELPIELSEVRCDSERIRQVLLNLISNAVRFTHYGTITVNAKSIMQNSELGEEKYIAVSVVDTGSGMDEERLAHIFDRYYSREANEGVASTGTGLGLYISQRIIAEHGGTIVIQSMPGEGTVATFTLPIRNS